MCPGITALLRVVQAKKIRRPRDDQQQCGQLLVAERVTDPAVGRLRDDRGWRRVQRSSMYRRWVHRSIAAASPRSLITHNHCALAGRAHTHAPTHKPSATVSFGHRNLSPDASNPVPDFPIGAVQLLTPGRECSSSLAPEPTHPPNTSRLARSRGRAPATTLDSRLTLCTFFDLTREPLRVVRADCTRCQ